MNHSERGLEKDTCFTGSRPVMFNLITKTAQINVMLLRVPDQYTCMYLPLQDTVEVFLDVDIFSSLLQDILSEFGYLLRLTINFIQYHFLSTLM